MAAPVQQRSGGGHRAARTGVTLALAALACLACYGLGWRLGSSSVPWLDRLKSVTSGHPVHLHDDQATTGASSSSQSSAATITHQQPQQQRGSFDWESVVAKLPEADAPQPLPWGSFTTVIRCDDTCARAKDGVCDDGRRGDPMTSRPVHCDLGTDCSDCGVYEGMDMIPSPWPEGGPVAHLTQGKDVKLFSRSTVTTPSFQMLFTDPEEDLDVSNYVDKNGIIESGITEIFRMVLEGNCYDSASGKRKLVLDVGANFGYFSVYAARMGCRVIAWEPIPMFRAFLHYALAVNHVAHLVEVRDRAVTEQDMASIPMQVPRKGIWGTASIKGINQQGHQEPIDVTVLTERLDSVVKEDVLLMKVDVEGFEPVVFKSATALFQQHEVDNVVLEYNPGVAEHLPYTTPALSHLITDTPKMLLRLLKEGYRIGLMLDHVAKGHPYTRTNAFPPLPEVNASHLAYDLDDAHKYLQVHTTLANREVREPYNKLPPGLLNCPPQSELMALNHEMWAQCAHMPEDAHPKSLRVAFVYNANLWAARTSKHIKFHSKPPGILRMDEDPQTSWSTHKGTGIGVRSCVAVPPHYMVRNRCPCTFLVTRNASTTEVQACVKEQAIVDRLLQTGTFKFATLPAAQLWQP